METWRTTKETAEQVGRDERTVRRWCAQGGPLHTVALRDQDGQWQIPQTWIDGWLEEHPAEEEQGNPETLPLVPEQAVILDMLRQGIAADVTAAMSEELTALRNQLNASENRRDKQVMALIRELQATRREMVELRRPWWQKFFSRRDQGNDPMG